MENDVFVGVFSDLNGALHEAGYGALRRYEASVALARRRLTETIPYAYYLLAT